LVGSCSTIFHPTQFWALMLSLLSPQLPLFSRLVPCWFSEVYVRNSNWTEYTGSSLLVVCGGTFYFSSHLTCSRTCILSGIPHAGR
jgi:hypothetical protein